MPDSALPDTTVLTSSFYETYIRPQVIVACTSSTRPTGVEGRRIFETDTELEYVYTGSAWLQMGSAGAWTSWTPTVTQSGSVTCTNTRSRYSRYGRTIHFSIDLIVTGSGTGNNAITISLPVTAAAAACVTGGSGTLYDASVPATYPFVAGPSTTSAFQLIDSATASNTPQLGLTGSSMSAALATNDIIRCSCTYEAAS